MGSVYMLMGCRNGIQPTTGENRSGSFVELTVNFDVATLLLIGSITLILGLALTVAYKVRARRAH